MDSGQSLPVTIAFLDFELLPARRLLLRAGSQVAIGARAFDLLTLLAAHPGEVLSNRTLIAGVWQKTVVIEANLRVQIAALRKLLGDDGAAIVNVAGRGYCLTARVRRLGARHATLAPAPAPARARACPRRTPPSIGRLLALELAGL